MAVLLTLELPGGTTAHYDQAKETAGLGEGDAPPGLIAHVCAVTDDGLEIVEVWDTVNALDDFVRHRLNPALAEAGIADGTPRISPVHDLIFGTGKEPNILIRLDVFGLTTEAYDGIVAKMPSHDGSGESHPAMLYVGAADPDTFRVASLYGSEEEYKEFATTQMLPAVDNPRHLVLRAWPVHDCLVARSRASA
jgi:hypothetical protein